MKRAISGFLVAAASVFIFGIALGDRGAESPGNLPGSTLLLPADNEINGWKRSEKLNKASKDEELYKILNGGAGLYIGHGFRSFAGQNYKGPGGWKLEVYVFDQGTPQNAQNLYDDPFTKSSQNKELADLGEKARIDAGNLFGYGVEFVRKGFFVRVFIQNRTQEGLDAALRFARAIADRIQ